MLYIIKGINKEDISLVRDMLKYKDDHGKV